MTEYLRDTSGGVILLCAKCLADGQERSPAVTILDGDALCPECFAERIRPPAWVSVP